MCIVSNENIQVSDGNVSVLKVLVGKGRYCFAPYRNSDGSKENSAHKPYFVPTREAKSQITNIIAESAIDSFCDGFGISCFTDVQAAKKYSKIVSDSEGVETKLVRFRLPFGSLYQKGTIKKGFKGSGLPAVRCTQLEPVVG